MLRFKNFQKTNDIIYPTYAKKKYGYNQSFSLVLKNYIVNPPTFQIKLSSLVVKPVSNFVANNPPNCSIVHVSGSVTREEYSL